MATCDTNTFGSGLQRRKIQTVAGDMQEQPPEPHCSRTEPVVSPGWGAEECMTVPVHFSLTSGFLWGRHDLTWNLSNNDSSKPRLISLPFVIRWNFLSDQYDQFCNFYMSSDSPQPPWNTVYSYLSIFCLIPERLITFLYSVPKCLITLEPLISSRFCQHCCEEEVLSFSSHHTSCLGIQGLRS